MVRNHASGLHLPLSHSLQLGALNDYLLPAELDEARRVVRPPRAPKERQPQPVTGRKRLAEPGQRAAAPFDDTA